MKILILAEDVKKISLLIRNNNEYKVIDEYDIVKETVYNIGIDQPYYSDSLIKRVSTISKIYNFNKPLCLVIDQRHKNTVDKIPHDISIRICKSLKPNRLSDSFTQTVDRIYLEKDFDGHLAQLEEQEISTL